MKVLIVNQHSSNFGDDAAGCALVQILLAEKKVESIDIIYNACQQIPVEDDRVHHHLDVKLSTAGYVNVLMYMFGRFLGIAAKGNGKIMKKWAQIIEHADVVFVAPCGANIGIYKDWAFLVRVLMVVLAKKKVVFHYNTIGASGNQLFDKLALFILKRSELYVRERKSEAYVGSLSLTSTFGPDTAFALKSIENVREQEVISLVPSAFDHWHPSFRDFPIDEKIQKELMPQLARWSRDKNMKIQILPHLLLEDEARYNEVIAKCLKDAGQEDVIIRRDIQTVWDYDRAIAESSLVIGMRYHTVVLAAKNYKPFVALAYENKMNEVCGYTHMEPYLLDLNEFAQVDDFNMLPILEMAYVKRNEIAGKLKNSINGEIRPLVNIPVNKNCT